MTKKILIMNLFLVGFSLSAMQLNRLSIASKMVFNRGANKLVSNRFRSFSISREDAYKIFGLPTGTSISKGNLKKAYYSLAKLYHPDANINWQSNAENKFKNINVAYKIIIDEQNSDDTNSISFDSLKKQIESDYNHWVYEQEKIKAEQEYEQFKREQERLEKEAQEDKKRKRIRNILSLSSIGALSYTGYEIYKHYKQSCLEAAVMYGENQKLKELLENKNAEELNKLTSDGYSLLHLAIIHNNTDAIEILVKAGIKLTILDANHFNALEAAGYYGNELAFEKLLQLDSRQDFNTSSLLSIILHQGHHKLATKIIDNKKISISKSDINAIISSNNLNVFTALMDRFAAEFLQKKEYINQEKISANTDNLEKAWAFYNSEYVKESDRLNKFVKNREQIINLLQPDWENRSKDLEELYYKHDYEIRDYLIQAKLDEINTDLQLRKSYYMNDRYKQCSWLQLAVKFNDYKTIALLVAKGADLNKSIDGKTPLLYATNGVLIQYLVQNGANINIQDKNGDSILHFAFKKRNLELIKSLLANNQLFKKKNYSGEIPLHLISDIKDSKNNHKDAIEIVKLMQPDKEMLTTTDYNGKGILKYYSEFCPFDLTIKELQNNPNQNIDDLFIKNCEHVKRIKDFADISIKDRYSFSWDNSKIKAAVKNYIELGHDLNYQPKGYSLLHYAVHNNDLILIKSLLDKGLDVNTLDKDGKTPIFYTNNIELIKFLKANGAKTDIKDKDGKSLIHDHLDKYSTWENINEFLDLKNFEPDNNGNNPWHYVARQCYTDKDKLIRFTKMYYPLAKDSLNNVNNEGQTPIAIAQAQTDKNCKTFAKILDDLNNTK